MQKSICFVDDDREELRRFKENLSKDFIIGIGTSIVEALEDLNKHGKKKPDLWILDMYFPENIENTIKEKKEILHEWKEFLKSKNKFQTLLAKYGQSSHGGLQLARTLRNDYNQNNIIFFTRKGMIDDAIRVLKENALKIIKKPDFNDEELVKANQDSLVACDIAFERKSKDIAFEIKDTIIKTTFWFKNKKFIIGIIIGFFTSVASRLIIEFLFQ